MLSRYNLIKCCYLVAFMDLFAVGMLLPLFNRRGRELGASPSTLGIVGSIYGGLQVFSSPYIGKVSDAWGRKPVLLLSFVGSFVGYLMLGLTDTILLFAIARIPTGILKHSQTSVKAYLSDITLPEERATVLGRFNAVGSLGFIIAPIIGGTVAMQDKGFLKVSLMSCSVYLFGLVFVWFVLENREVKKNENAKLRNAKDDTEIIDKSSQPSDIVERHKKMNSEPKLAKNKENDSSSTFSKFFSFLKIDSVQSIIDILCVRFFMALSMLIYRNNFTPMLEFRYGINAKIAGYIISYGSIIGALSGMSVGTIDGYVKSDAKMMFYASLLMTSSLFGITISPHIYTVLLCMAPLSLSTAIMRVNSHNLILKRIKPEEKGAVMGVGDSMTSIARMLSPAIAGFALEFSVTGPCWLSICCAVVGIVLQGVLRENIPTTDAKKKTN